MAKILTRDDILAADDLSRIQVHVEAWGGDVIVRAMTGAERDLWEESIQKRKREDESFDLKNIRAELLSMVLVDESGKNLFTRGDIDALGKKAADPLTLLFDAARKLSGINEEDVEELAKNSEPGQGDDSHSD